ncbi:MAG: class I SAM-dependent methyltransferase [Terriglobales bacterium]
MNHLRHVSPGEFRLRPVFHDWLKEHFSRDGFLRTLLKLFVIFWQFLRDSLPSRRRQRYGDVDYDWDYRVDTTSATVSWRDRLLGLLHSPYQPTDPALFQEMLASLAIDFSEFVFIDMGSGKGRTLLMASNYPFRRVIGVELLPELHRVAQENIGSYKNDSQQCLAIESICGDAREFAFPPEPTVLYLFNPLPEPGLVQLLTNLEQSLREHPRPLFVLYHNPVLEHVLAESKYLKKMGGTHQYSIFARKM